MLHELAHLPDDDRFTAISWIDDLDRIREAGKRQRTSIVKSIAARRGVCESTVWNKFRAVAKKGAAALTDGRKREARRASRPVKGFVAGRPDDAAAFQTHVHNLYRDHNRSRSGVSVHEHLIAQWHAWRLDPYNPERKIGGYDQCPAPDRACGELHPAGWSLRNIQRMAPEKFDLTLSRIGLTKAKELLPPVITTRVGLLPGEVYMLDDMHCNNLVDFRGEVVRPLMLAALDLHSGMDLARYYRPRLTNAPEGQKEITERETLWFVLHILTNFGYRTDRPTIFVVENAKATIREAFEESLLRVFNGQVLVHRGEISGNALKYFGGPSKGNPRFKAARESWFNLFQNRLGMLPGSIGSSPDTAPEEMSAHQRSAMVRYHQQILDEAAERMPLDVIMEMKMEILPWNRFVRAAETIAGAINDRTRHKLEGYKALGYQTIEYRRPGGQWVNEREFLALPSGERAEMSRALQSGQKDWRPRNFSPREVWDAEAPRLTKLHPSRWHLLIPSHFGIRRTVPKNRQLRIDDAQISAETIILNHTAMGLDGRERIALQPGQDVILHINPWRPDCALVMREDGSPIGVVPRIVPQTRLDQEALLAQYVERNKLVGDIGADAIEHAREVYRKREAIVDHNAALGFKAGSRRKGGKKVMSAAEMATEAAKKRLAQGSAPLAGPPDAAAGDDDDDDDATATGIVLGAWGADAGADEFDDDPTRRVIRLAK